MSAAKKKKTTSKASAKKTSKKTSAAAKKSDKKTTAKKAKPETKKTAKVSKAKATKTTSKKTTAKKATTKAVAKKASKVASKAKTAKVTTTKTKAKASTKATPAKKATAVKPVKKTEATKKVSKKAATKSAVTESAKAAKAPKESAAKKTKKTKVAAEASTNAPKVDPKSITEGLVKTETKVKVADVLLTDAEGRVLCRFAGCDAPAVVEGYCRYHYLLNWKKIQLRKKILAEGKLENYINELTARYPDKYLEMMKSDLKSEKDFLAAVQELEIDDPDAAMSDSDAENYLEEVRGIRGENRGGSDDDY